MSNSSFNGKPHLQNVISYYIKIAFGNCNFKILFNKRNLKDKVRGKK